jgi:hypothetical protein
MSPSVIESLFGESMQKYTKAKHCSQSKNNKKVKF